MKKLRNIGIVAHVDAGKTTLTEQILFQSGQVRVLGSVDQGSSILDSSPIERERGITVFAAQGVISWKGTPINIIDTPGHTDFTQELERCLPAFDGAILLLSGVEGVQSHTLTIWQKLRKRNIPTLIFVNKLDRVGADPERIYREIRDHLTDVYLPLQRVEGLEKEFHGVADLWQEKDFESQSEETQQKIECLAGLDDLLMEKYLSDQEITYQDVREGLRRLVAQGKVFPVLFGASLHGIGVAQLLDAVVDFLPSPQGNREAPFQGIVYKVRMDEGMGQLTFIRVLNGKVRPRQTVLSQSGETEKITQIRQYTGNRYGMLEELEAGDIGVLCGLKKVKVGEFIGEEIPSQGKGRTCERETFEKLDTLDTPDTISASDRTLGGSAETLPVLVCEVTPNASEQLPQLLKAMEILNKEEPSLQLQWEPENQSLQVHLNGLIQMEVLKELLRERFDLSVELKEPRINYFESVTECTRGFCHFEPKKHYAEVEVEIEPLERGSGIEYRSQVSLDELPAPFQSAIEKAVPDALKRGVLARFAVTDLRVTLVAGKHHLEHTHGGDFRIATIRAVQQALERNHSILLEPIYSYQIIVDSGFAGRVFSDILKLNGTMEEPEHLGNRIRITGKVPVATALSYPLELTSLTSGKGMIQLNVCGYERCHNEAEVLEYFAQNITGERSVEENILYNSVTLFREKKKMKKVTTDELE